ANRYPDGVRFVDLATLRDPALLPQKLAVSLRVPRAAGRSDTDRLIEGLRDKRLLLLLDNAEHMVSACADLAWKLLRACPGLSILTTTREALSIEGESVLRLGRLDDHGEETATALFLDRARARDPAFSEDADALAVVGRICHRLDGIPLAIELAATWADVLAPGEILARLEQRLALLDRTGGPGSADATATDPRHTGLRAMIDWSHDRLSEEERALFRRLSVFHGGWSLETAEQVCLRPDQAGWGSLDRMRSLLAKSVIERVPSAERPGTSRYRMLETFREYAEEKLREAGEEAEFLKRRFEAFHRIFEARRLVGPEQTDWIARFREEEDNLRATLAARHTSAIAPSDAAAFGLKLTGFWIRLGRWEEGRRTLASLLVELREAGDGRTRLYGAVAHSCAELARSQGDLEAASSLAREALAIATEFGDDRLQSSCHNELGNVAKLLEDFESARRSYDACLAHLDPGSDPWHYAGVVFNRGVAFAEQGRFAEAEADFRESLRVKQEIGDERGVAHVLNGLGLIRKEMGAFDEARALLEESLEHKRKIDDRPGILLTLLNLGNLENNICAQPRTERERLDRAVDRFSEGLALARAIGDRSGEARLLGGLGFTRFLQGDLAAARLTLEESLAISASSSGGISGRTAQLGLAFVALEERRLDDARRHAIEALRESPRLRRDVAAQPLDLLAFVADASGSTGEALRLVALARRLREGVPRGDARWESGWRADLERRILEAVGRQAFDEAVESAPVLSVEELLVRLDSASS
ncbi:MAG: tetratricopeptide repeat protein, partial [Candidatus Eisenbacteria bacterium]|nr:tetratricopeptide repeat protein [Candidatus Eisenbacteria bacterium]